MSALGRSLPITVPVLLAAALALAGVATSGEAAAQKKKPPPPTGLVAPADVETAEQLYAKLDYEGARSVAERVLQKSGLSHEQLVRAYRVLAVTAAILDDADASREAFFQLLVLDPEYSVDMNLGPKVSNPFVEARGTYRSLPQKPGVEVSAAVRTDGGRLRVTTRDPRYVISKVLVGHRWTSTGDFSISEIAVGTGVPVEVPPAPAGRTRLDYWAQGLDAKDNVILEAGNAQVPKSAFAEAASKPGGGGAIGKEEGGSVFSSPVFWVVTGALLLGGGATAFFLIRPDQETTAAALTPAIRCGADPCR